MWSPPVFRRDLNVLDLAYEKIRRFIPLKQLHMITARRDFDSFALALGPEVVLPDEDLMIDGVTLQSLKTIPLARFSQGPGWYFQQLLKYQFAFHEPEDDYFLIWDADTIPLRKLEFFDGQGRMLLTKAEEYHPRISRLTKKSWASREPSSLSTIGAARAEVLPSGVLKAMALAQRLRAGVRMVRPWPRTRNPAGICPLKFEL